MGEEGRKMTSAMLGQVLLTDHRTRTVMCSSLTLMPCCRLPSTHAGHPTWADPSCLRPFCCCCSQGNIPSVFLGSIATQPHSLCHRAVPRSVFGKHDALPLTSPFFPKSPGLSAAAHSTRPVLKVPVRGNMLLLWMLLKVKDRCCPRETLTRVATSPLRCPRKALQMWCIRLVHARFKHLMDQCVRQLVLRFP